MFVGLLIGLVRMFLKGTITPRNCEEARKVPPSKFLSFLLHTYCGKLETTICCEFVLNCFSQVLAGSNKKRGLPGSSKLAQLRQQQQGYVAKMCKQAAYTHILMDRLAPFMSQSSLDNFNINNEREVGGDKWEERDKVNILRPTYVS
jgi:hypothetical protein